MQDSGNDAASPITTEPTLHTTFALDQLKRVAGSYSLPVFRVLIGSVFGTAISTQRYTQLHDDVLNDRLVNPQCQVIDSDASGAAYDSTEQVIRVPRQAIETALDRPDATPALLLSLLSAFGDYLNQTLQDGVQENVDGDSLQGVPKDSTPGERYASCITLYDVQPTDQTPFADYASSTLSGALLLTLPGTDVPDFPAGHGSGEDHSWAHGRLSTLLLKLGFSDEQVHAIYFGNWLRDYSQLIDPKIVRHPDAPKDFPSKISRQALTQVVDLFAVKEFHSLQDSPEKRQTYTVTPEMLGVYRASEHIDNPLTLDTATPDPTAIDGDFEPLVMADSPQAAIDEARRMQGHIESAENFMYQRLIDAMNAGPTPEGLRYFGEALHTLEDYFAHSNFVELSLRKVGHDQILPWFSLADGSTDIPVVTGLFSGTDILASVAEPLAELLFSTPSLEYTPTRPGDRSPIEQMLLILLKEHHQPLYLETLTSYLAIRDRMAGNALFQTSAHVSWAVSLPVQALSLARNYIFKKILIWAGEQIDDYQTLYINDPNTQPGTHPTHSQLAKDHDTHPFHLLAAYMAGYAVETVGRAMSEYWAGNHDRDPASVAKAFIVHPRYSDWQDEVASTWARLHPEEMEAGASSDEFTRRQRQAEKESRQRLKEMSEKYNIDFIETNQISTNLLFG